MRRITVFPGTASKDFRLTLADSAKDGYGKAEYVKAVKKDDRSTIELTFRLTFNKKTTASTTSTVKSPAGVTWSPDAYGTGIWSAGQRGEILPAPSLKGRQSHGG